MIRFKYFKYNGDGYFMIEIKDQNNDPNLIGGK